MSYLRAVNREIQNTNWGWLLAWGILLVILGVAAFSMVTLTTLVSIIALGTILLIAGVFIIIEGFTTWWGLWGVFFLDIVLGILYLLVGIMLIENPVMASFSLTLLLGIFYLVIGIFRIIFSLSYRMINWKFNLLSGLIALLLGILILANLPTASLYIIGLFVGIDLIFWGWTYIIVALRGKKLKARA